MSDGLFLVLSKLAWALLSPDSLIVLLALGGWLFLLAGRQRAARALIALCTLLLLWLSFVPLGEWILAPLEKRFPANVALPAQVDGIVVLGGAIDPVLSAAWQQAELGGGAERVTAFAYLASLYPDAQLVYTGGSGDLLRQQDREADFAPYLLGQLGLGNRAIIYESESRNTWENAVNCKQLVNVQTDEEWILVTSAYHMPRAVGVFCQRGWPVTPYPVDHQSESGNLWRVQFGLLGNLGELRTGLREWLALIAYRITGRSDRLLPGAGRQCQDAAPTPDSAPD